MSKKVRYAIGAIGVVPALGVLAQPAAASAHPPKQPAHTSKTVRIVQPGHTHAHPFSASSAPSTTNLTCTASRKHTVHASFLTLTFWSKPVSGRTCVGTIDVAYSGNNPNHTGALVQNAFGQFCIQNAAGRTITDTCRHVFRRNSLRVIGVERNANGSPFAAVSDYYPFIG